MAGRSRSFRQLFIVDLVTLILLVLIIAMKSDTQVEAGTPGMREALQFRFKIIDVDANDPTSPMLGVLYKRSQGPVISEPKGLEEEAGVVSLISNGTETYVSIFEPPGERDSNGRALILFARDRGQRTNVSMTVLGEYFHTEANEWRVVFGSQNAGGLRTIQMIDQGMLNLSNALVEIDLNGVRKNGGATPVWEPIGGVE